MMILRRKPSFFALITTIGAVSIMLALGIWQVQRLMWKEALIQTIEEASSQPPMDGLPESDEALQALTYEKILVEGEFLNAYELHLAARYHRGVLGYHVLTPFRLLDGRVILLNRGWVPTDKKEASTRPSSIVIGPHKELIMIRSDRDHTYFTPQHQPERNIWFWRDLDAIRAQSGLNLLPVNADIVGEQSDQLPVPATGEIKLRNDHLGYAITWFSVGLAALVIFIIYHRKPADL